MAILQTSARHARRKSEVVPASGLLHVLRNRRKLFQRRLQIRGDVGGDDFGSGQVGGFFECVVLQPEDVEVHLVALGQFVVGERFETLALFRLCRFFGL